MACAVLIAASAAASLVTLPPCRGMRVHLYVAAPSCSRLAPMAVEITDGHQLMNLHRRPICAGPRLVVQGDDSNERRRRARAFSFHQ